MLKTSAFLSTFMIVGCFQHTQENVSPVEISSGKSVPEKLSSKTNTNWVVEFSEDFSNINIGEEPEELFILDGAYTVQLSPSNEKSLTLPGSPMGDFGVLFGPRIREKAIELRFSFFSTKKGRRLPSIAAGIGGVRGLRLRLNPAAKKLILFYDDEVLKEIPFNWVAGQWWSMRLQMSPEDLNKSTFVRYKLWQKQKPEPSSWLFKEKFDIEYKGGKCAIWGFPYASTPIFFDDISILSI